MKRLLLLVTGCMMFFGLASAQLQILPDIDASKAAEVNQAIENVLTDGGGSTNDKYYQEAHRLEGQCGVQIASGIMTWNTILCYAGYLVEFISQLGLLVGGIMIIVAGYQYAMYIFNGNEGNANDKIKNAIIGVVIIIFSYAILKIVTTAFLT